MDKNRIIGLDIIRFLAIFFVLSVHFLGFISFHSIPMQGFFMGFQMILRQLFFLCIPLFILLTGYLQSKKIFNKKYYKGIIPIIMIYLLYSILSLLFRLLFQNEQLSFKQAVLSIFNFTANSRAWYVNMYIGLFCMIPFLNKLYMGLDSKKEKTALLCTMLFITAIPGFINNATIFNNESYTIFPDWWQGIYPITYYFIGVFLSDFKPKINKKILLLLFASVLLIQSGLYYIECNGGVMEYTFKVQYNGNLLSMIAATLLFLILYDIDIKNKLVRYCITDFSLLSFEIYLLSFVSDYFLYPYFIEKYYKTEQQFFKYYIILVPASFIMSYCLAFLRRFITNIIFNSWRKLSVYRMK